MIANGYVCSAVVRGAGKFETKVIGDGGGVEHPRNNTRLFLIIPKIQKISKLFLTIFGL